MSKSICSALFNYSILISLRVCVVFFLLKNSILISLRVFVVLFQKLHTDKSKRIHSVFFSSNTLF